MGWSGRASLSLALFAASPAAAFDCSKAATADEKAICADPLARAADSAMAAAFSKRHASESRSAKRTLVAAQGRWLTARDRDCMNAKPLSPCLAEQSARRRAFLAGEPEAGPGAPGRLAPDLRIENGSKSKADINLQLLEYPAAATPAERAFNAGVEALVGSLDEPDAGDPSPEGYAHERTMRLVYASPKLISAHLRGYEDTGGAHPNTFSGDVNVLVAQGRQANFADLLDARGAKTVFALCLKQVIAAKKARIGADAPVGPDFIKDLTKDVVEATGKLDAWSFAADKATVSYDPYAVGAYAEGAYACVIPYATLKPLAKPGFPLP
ncbi:MAG TPA: lysozyme inhibitor LprI family protein [Roseiarcus sp.]|nr:lysozyme inhibitor LprI family protein [Roseiarcus sp.]